MSTCHGCASGFGFLKRELGCPKCGFSYCKKCLRFKLTDPKTSKEIFVCNRCFKLNTSNMVPEEPPIITNALLRLESMENPSRPPITVYKQQHAREARLAQLKKGLSTEDQEIADRLVCLRKPDVDDTTSRNANAAGKRRSSDQIAEEIEIRLARLKGEEESSSSLKPSVSQPQVGKTNPETDADLIKKYSEEVELDKRYQSQMVGDIEDRLAKLRGDDAPGTSTVGRPNSGSMEIEEISEEEEIQRIIARFKAEVELETRIPITDQPETISSDITPPATENIDVDSDEDLDNLCRICEEKRATLKCDECDGDLFCTKCFDELHNELGEVHKPKKYQP